MIGTRRKLEAHGIGLLNIGILDLHCDPALVLGLPGRDPKIEQYFRTLPNFTRPWLTTVASICTKWRARCGTRILTAS